MKNMIVLVGVGWGWGGGIPVLKLTAVTDVASTCADVVMLLAFLKNG